MGESSVVINCLDPVSVFEIVEESLSIGNEILSTVEALFKLGKLIITSESVNETGNKVWDSHGIEAISFVSVVVV